jgi:hypothetical protein
MNKLHAIAAITALSAIGSAQIVFDNTASENGTTNRNPSDAPALQITNTNSYTVNLTSVFFSGQSNLNGENFDFFLADGAGNLINQVFQPESLTGPHTLIGANVSWTLQPGQTYYIGAMSGMAPASYDYIVPGYSMQNGLQSGPNGNFSSYGLPTFYGNGAAEMAWQLNGSPVPEPGALMAMAVGVIGIAVRRRRR